MPYGLFDYIPDSPIHTMGAGGCPEGEAPNQYIATDRNGQVVRRWQVCVKDPNYRPPSQIPTAGVISAGRAQIPTAGVISAGGAKCPVVPTTLTGGGYTYKLS